MTACVTVWTQEGCVANNTRLLARNAQVLHNFLMMCASKGEQVKQTLTHCNACKKSQSPSRRISLSFLELITEKLCNKLKRYENCFVQQLLNYTFTCRVLLIACSPSLHFYCMNFTTNACSIGKYCSFLPVTILLECDHININYTVIFYEHVNINYSFISELLLSKNLCFSRPD